MGEGLAAGNQAPHKGHLHPGFAAMEYYGLILNRSFLIFVRPEGLYGWKFFDLVSSATPQYFQGIEEYLDKPELTPGSPEFDQLMRKSGSFFIPKADIESVQFVNKRKGGMGPVPHSGRLYICFRSNKRREFVLLGRVDGDGIRNQMRIALGL